jgi:hypothetical protein
VLLLRAMDTLLLYHSSVNSKAMPGNLYIDLASGNQTLYPLLLLVLVILITSSNNRSSKENLIMQEVDKDILERLIWIKECTDSSSKELKQVVALRLTKLREIYLVFGEFLNSSSNNSRLTLEIKHGFPICLLPCP